MVELTRGLTSGQPMANERIFVSYRRRDQPNDVNRLRKKLERKLGSVTFVDAHSIRYGIDFADKISQALSDCEILLAVIGPRWEEILKQRTDDEKQDFVRTEIGEALKRGIPVIPVLLNRTEMPSAADLPAVLEKLAARQGLVLQRRWFRYVGLKDLVWAIRSRFLEDRFDGQPRIDAFRRQDIIKDCRNKDSLANMFAEKSKLTPLDKGKTLYPIDSDGNRCLYFVLSGSFSLRTSWWRSYHLKSNEIVGEFPILLSEQTSYAASVKARERSLVARVSEKVFTDIADVNPDLWKSMAQMLVKRLLDSNKQRRRVEVWASVATFALAAATIATVVYLSVGARG